MLLLVNNVQEQMHKDRRNLESSCTLLLSSTCVTILHLRYNFALVLHEKSLGVSQSEVPNFSCTLFLYENKKCSFFAYEVNLQ